MTRTVIVRLGRCMRGMKHPRALFSALICASVLSLVLGQSENYDFTLQERPVNFTQEPLSQAVLLGSTVTFNCIASVRDLPILNNEDYTLPVFSWRHNGETLPGIESEGSNKWSIISNITHSELHIQDVSESDSGYYECVCSDGLHSVGVEDRYVTVTVSRRASLEVIVLSSQTVDLEEVVNVSLGEHLLLDCNTGASHDPHHVEWKKDGNVLSPAEVAEVGVILNNKSLLLFNVSTSTAGRYQCIGRYSEEDVNGTSYDVTITNGTAENAVILDAPSVFGDTVTLTCYVTGEEIQTVEWLKDGTQIGLDTVTTFASTVQLTTDDSGVYSCKITNSHIQASITIISPPRIIGDGRIRKDKRLLVSDLELVPIVSVRCELSLPASPSTVIYWYKDGENVTDFYDSTSGELNYVLGENEEVDNLFGVYQCFAENSAGVDYTITRVLPTGFSNPPGNFTCITVDQDDADEPRFILHWDRPFTSGFPTIVQTLYQLTIEMRSSLLETYNEIEATDYIVDDIHSDGNYEFSVFVPGTGRDGARATCIVSDSFIDRRNRVVRELDVSCPIDPGQPIKVEWNNPGVYNTMPGDSQSLEPVVNFISVCLYNGTDSLQPLEDPEFLDYYDGRLYDVERVMLFSMDPVPGAVCLFGGHYKTSDSRLSQEIPFTSVTCSFPAYENTADVQLRVSCSDSVVEVGWWSSSSLDNTTSVSVQGKCVTPTWDQTSLNVSLHAGESDSIMDDLPDNSVCTFYGSYQAESGVTTFLDPVQCIVGGNTSLIPATQPPRTTSEPQETTSDDLQEETTTTTTTPSTTIEQTTNGNQGRNVVVYPVVFTLVGVLVVAILITASMVVVCCVLRYVHGMKERYKQQLQPWYKINEEDDITQFEDPPILPDYPPFYRMSKEIDEDTQSRLTHVDYLFREELGSTHLSNHSLTSLVKSVNPPIASRSEPTILNGFLDSFDGDLRKNKSDTFHMHTDSDVIESEFDDSDIQSNTNNSSIHDESELQDKLHSCAVMTEPPAHLQIDREFIQLVKETPVTAHPPDYKHSAGSSGYGTAESEIYFSSNTTDYPRTSEYFKSREAELSEMLSVCKEEKRECEDVCDMNTKTSLCPQASSDSEGTQDLTCDGVKISGSTQSLPTLGSSDRFRPLYSGHNHKELDNNFKRSIDSSGSSPLYLNYTDEEGYLHLEYRGSDI